MRRVFLLTLPLYLLIGVLNHFEVFTTLATKLSPALNEILSPASITIIAAQMSNIMNAASIAAAMIEGGTLSQLDVFTALLFG